MSNEKNKTVVVGITGKIDSVVAAYLLKKQGFSCIGICIQNVEPLKQNVLTDKAFGSCQIKQVTQVQQICNELEIPFYAVNAHELYHASVVDLVVARRLSGEAFCPCIACNKMKFEILWEKAKKLGASWVATGHYAKIGQNQKTGERYLVSAGGIDEDQAILLSGLNASSLEHILLPLGDMRRSEVEKIAVSLNMGLTVGESHIKNCFEDYASVAKYIEAHVARSLRQEGDIINAEDGSILGNHLGIYHFKIGQGHIVSKENATPIDPNLKVIALNAIQKRVYLANIPGFEFDYCSVNKFVTPLSIDWSRSMMGFAQFYGMNGRLPCLIRRKTNDSIVLEFTNRHHAFFTVGLSVAVYNKSGAGAKLLGSGILGMYGIFQKLDRTSSTDEKSDERKDKIKKQKDLSLF